MDSDKSSTYLHAKLQSHCCPNCHRVGMFDIVDIESKAKDTTVQKITCPKCNKVYTICKTVTYLVKELS